MEIVALRSPILEGSNSTTQVVLFPVVTDAAGGVVTENSDAWAPENEIVPIVRLALPLLLMVYVTS